MKTSLMTLAALFALASQQAAAANIGAAEICKAAIGKTMGRSPSIIQIDGTSAGIYSMSYVRDDGTLWSYRCKLEGNQVIWASDKGRWRTKPEDGKLTYQVTQDRKKVTIIEDYGDGSKSQETYDLSAF
ncbi:hypothetical protein [Terrihabitans sp. B22-R8]|uniref:hypothetical protein n=1 Tax=Terrihabitans sp. B22-R8 TaxID=3425128 RepID=UPI00403C4F50